MRWIPVLLFLGCTGFPYRITEVSEYSATSRFEGVVVQTCAEVTNGCQMGIAVAGQHNVRDVFVPWGTELYGEAKSMPIYSNVTLEAVDRGDGMFVLRSIKEN